jgi:predicted RNA binding protein YcfA (HicA-like mRNA interferase family)
MGAAIAMRGVNSLNVAFERELHLAREGNVDKGISTLRHYVQRIQRGKDPLSMEYTAEHLDLPLEAIRKLSAPAISPRVWRATEALRRGEDVHAAPSSLRSFVRRQVDEGTLTPEGLAEHLELPLETVRKLSNPAFSQRPPRGVPSWVQRDAAIVKDGGIDAATASLRGYVLRLQRGKTPMSQEEIAKQLDLPVATVRQLGDVSTLFKRGGSIPAPPSAPSPKPSPANALSMNRDRLGWTQEEAAAHLGLPLDGYKKLESQGQTRINLFKFTRHAKELGSIPQGTVATPKPGLPPATREIRHNEAARLSETRPKSASSEPSAPVHRAEVSAPAQPDTKPPEPSRSGLASPRSVPGESRPGPRGIEATRGQAQLRKEAPQPGPGEAGEARPRGGGWRGVPWGKQRHQATRDARAGRSENGPPVAASQGQPKPAELQATRANRNRMDELPAGLPAKRVVAALKRLDVIPQRQTGSHMVLLNPENGSSTVLVFRRGSDNGVSAKSLCQSLEQLGISNQAFLDKL